MTKTDYKFAAAKWIVTCGGVGLIRPGPGTWSSLTAGLAVWLYRRYVGDFGIYYLVLIAGFLIAYAAVEYYRRATGIDDPGEVVIDEVLAVAAFAPLFAGVAWQLVSMLVCFRILDISKFGPVGMLERRYNSTSGVMLDDLAAAFIAFLIVLVLRTVANPA